MPTPCTRRLHCRGWISAGRAKLLSRCPSMAYPGVPRVIPLDRLANAILVGVPQMRIVRIDMATVDHGITV